MMLPSKKERHVGFSMIFLVLSLPGNLRHSWASLGQARFVEVGSERWKKSCSSRPLDYVAECSGRAPGGWCCPWREARERICSTQRFPGANVSKRVFLPCASCLCLVIAGVTCNRWIRIWLKRPCAKHYSFLRNCGSRLQYLSKKRRHSKWCLLNPTRGCLSELWLPQRRNCAQNVRFAEACRCHCGNAWRRTPKANDNRRGTRGKGM